MWKHDKVLPRPTVICSIYDRCCQSTRKIFLRQCSINHYIIIKCREKECQDNILFKEIAKFSP